MVISQKIDELVYDIAVTQLGGIGVYHAKTLINYFDGARNVFDATISDLKKIDGIGPYASSKLIESRNAALDFAYKELEFIKANGINIHTIDSSSYPERLKECIDAPIVLYTKGQSNFNKDYMIAIVGTRSVSQYGIDICKKLVKDLSELNVGIVSGLAYGVDICAHKSCIEQQIPTYAVLGHGLDRIYPASHKRYVPDIINNGAIITEFPTGNIPDKSNFPKRNRIVAGMCDITIVVESGEKGCSLITSYIANDYTREVFAFPGRTNDYASKGCNKLIKLNRAHLIESADDIIDLLGWNRTKATPIKQNPIDTSSLSESQKLICAQLLNAGKVKLDDLASKTSLNVSSLLVELLNLELQNIVKSYPGKFYSLD